MLGNLRRLQGRQDDSHNSFNKALAQYRAVLGERHPQTANAMYKVSQHLIRCEKYEEAMCVSLFHALVRFTIFGTRLTRFTSTMINQALKTWSIDSEIYKPELARTTFLKAQVMQTLGKEQKATVALKVACRFWYEIKKEKKDPASMSLEDFDPLVPFFAR